MGGRGTDGRTCERGKARSLSTPYSQAVGGPVERLARGPGEAAGPTRQRLIVDGAHMSSEEDEKPAARQITFSLEDGTVLWEGTAVRAAG